MTVTREREVRGAGQHSIMTNKIVRLGEPTRLSPASEPHLWLILLSRLDRWRECQLVYFTPTTSEQTSVTMTPTKWEVKYTGKQTTPRVNINCGQFSIGPLLIWKGRLHQVTEYQSLLYPEFVVRSCHDVTLSDIIIIGCHNNVIETRECLYRSLV